MKYYIILVLFISCTLNNKHLKGSSEQGIKYSDFDIFKLKGINKLTNQEHNHYPFIEVIEKKDSLILINNFNKGQKTKKKFQKFNSYYLERKEVVDPSSGILMTTFTYITKKYILIFFYVKLYKELV